MYLSNFIEPCAILTTYTKIINKMPIYLHAYNILCYEHVYIEF